MYKIVFYWLEQIRDKKKTWNYNTIHIHSKNKLTQTHIHTRTNVNIHKISAALYAYYSVQVIHIHYIHKKTIHTRALVRTRKKRTRVIEKISNWQQWSKKVKRRNHKNTRKKRYLTTTIANKPNSWCFVKKFFLFLNSPTKRIN